MYGSKELTLFLHFFSIVLVLLTLFHQAERKTERVDEGNIPKQRGLEAMCDAGTLSVSVWLGGNRHKSLMQCGTVRARG